MQTMYNFIECLHWKGWTRLIKYGRLEEHEHLILNQEERLKDVGCNFESLRYWKISVPRKITLLVS